MIDKTNVLYKQNRQECGFWNNHFEQRSIALNSIYYHLFITIQREMTNEFHLDSEGEYEQVAYAKYSFTSVQLKQTNKINAN